MSAIVTYVPPVVWRGGLSAAQAAAYANTLFELAAKHRAEAEADPAEAHDLLRIAETDAFLAEGFRAVVLPLRRRECRRSFSAGGRAA